MLKTHLKTAWRTMVKDKTYATINILGLTIGLCACMLVGTVVLDDLSYDKFWSHKNELYRIITSDTTAGLAGKNPSVYANLGNTFKANFPDVEAAATVYAIERWMRKDKTDETAIQLDAIYADTNIWKLLDIDIIDGTPKHYVAGQNNLVISESFRKKHFSNESPVGKIMYSVSAYSEEATPYLITGVMADLPQNTYLRAEAIQVAMPSSHELSREGWGYYDEQLLLMKPNTDMVAFATKANRWYREFLTEASEDTKKRIPVYEFQPIQEVYLTPYSSYQRVSGNLSNIYIFSVVAGLLLFIACINFVNLSVARAVRRLKETGVRKVLGAGRRQLLIQYLTESLMFFVLSALLASGLYVLSLGPLEVFLGHTLTLKLLGNLSLFLIFLSTILMLSVVTGTYPAWMLSGFNTTNALKNRIGNTTSLAGAWIRHMLVTLQFGVALLVLIGMITVWRQVQYMEKKDVGFDTDRVLNIPQFALGNNRSALKNELEQLAGVQRVSVAAWAPTRGTGHMAKSVEHPNKSGEKVMVSFIAGDTHLPDLLGFRIRDGRLFESHDIEDENQPKNALLTASTAKLFGVTELGRPIEELSIIPVGIIDDFHSISLRNPIVPTVVIAEDILQYANILIKVQQGKESQVIKSVNELWQQFHAGKPLNMEWVDDLVKGQYEKETKQGQLFTFFSALTLLLAALGVFGLVVHATEQRVKEIGIRKVLGASVTGIVRMFSLDYVKLVGIALLVASPIAWWAMNKWLEDFAYRIDIQWWVFALAGVVALMIALVTVGVQAIKAALANPIDSLRDE
ncbi:ABC transporter permease [Parapedobacter koreensis]|uniref:Putative ABC transport system permease protein n=1 Tax=Parapedobacter koreensis TaxID=332977 RepID=A0A1H7R1Z8_9SPHI|nr:ABC transporter permease [Parapedobacter koreensis]SEL53607.1 putative ABC transport system permease protein [Parapedobacter koreensis]